MSSDHPADGRGWPQSWTALDPADRARLRLESRDSWSTWSSPPPDPLAWTGTLLVLPSALRAASFAQPQLGGDGRCLEVELPDDPELAPLFPAVLLLGPEGTCLLPAEPPPLSAFPSRAGRRVLMLVLPSLAPEVRLIVALVQARDRDGVIAAVEAGRGRLFEPSPGSALLGPSPATVVPARAPAPPGVPPLRVAPQGRALVRFGSTDDPWLAQLAAPHGADLDGKLDGSRIEIARRRALQELRPPRGLQLPAHLPQAATRERGVAGALLDAVLGGAAMARLRDRLCRTRGEAGLGGLTLGVDLRGAGAADLPWELLEAVPDDHALSGLSVVRVVPARPREPAEGRALEVLLWCPDPDDPVTRPFVEPLRGFLDGLEGVSALLLDPSLQQPPPPPAPGAVRVLHVLGHGQRSSDALARVDILGVGGPAGADQLSRRLAPVLATCTLAVLEVCEGAAAGPAELVTPAARFVAAGLPACVGPTRPVAATASSAFVEGLYAQLSIGASLLAAVQEGRRRVELVAISSHPAWRWWNQALLVGDLRTADASLIRPREGEGARPRLRTILDAAQVRGERDGFVGVEHVALALAEGEGPTALAAAFAGYKERILAPFSALRRLEGTEVQRTDRLAALLAQLPDLADPWALASALLRSPALVALLGPAAISSMRRTLLAGSGTAYSTAVSALASDGSPSGELRAGAGTASSTNPGALPNEDEPMVPLGGLVFEVVGGPEDGRVLRLHSPGQLLGRWGGRSSPGPGELFAGGATSSRVSRRHLEYLGGGRVRLLASGRHHPVGGGSVVYRVSRRSPSPDGPVLELDCFDRLLLDVQSGDQGVLLEVRSVPAIGA